MLTISPFQHVFDELVTFSSNRGTSQPRDFKSLLAAFYCFSTLQLAWISRVITIPVCAGLSSALAFGYADNAKDIVVDSVAIVFIFELDGILYRRMVSRGARARCAWIDGARLIEMRSSSASNAPRANAAPRSGTRKSFTQTTRLRSWRIMGRARLSRVTAGCSSCLIVP